MFVVLACSLQSRSSLLRQVMPLQVLAPVVRATWQRVPSVRDLQGCLEAAWQTGYDRQGGAQLSFRVVRPNSPDQKEACWRSGWLQRVQVRQFLS